VGSLPKTSRGERVDTGSIVAICEKNEWGHSKKGEEKKYDGGKIHYLMYSLKKVEGGNIWLRAKHTLRKREGER